MPDTDPDFHLKPPRALQRLRRMPIHLGELFGVVLFRASTRWRSDLRIHVDLPAGASFVRWYVDEATGCGFMVLWHESWDPVPEGGVIPLLPPAQLELVPRGREGSPLSNRQWVEQADAARDSYAAGYEMGYDDGRDSVLRAE